MKYTGSLITTFLSCALLYSGVLRFLDPAAAPETTAFLFACSLFFALITVLVMIEVVAEDAVKEALSRAAQAANEEDEGEGIPFARAFMAKVPSR